MAEKYEGSWDGKMWAVLPNVVCGNDREYVTHPIFIAGGSYINTYVRDHLVTFSTDGFYDSSPIDQYFAFYISGDSSDPSRGKQLQSNNGYVSINWVTITPDERIETQSSIAIPYEPVYIAMRNYVCSVMTNIPVFLDLDAFAIYTDPLKTETERLMALRKAINFSDIPIEAEGEEFEITNPWQHGTWTMNGPAPDSPVAYRNLRGKILWGSMALYNKGYEDGSLKMGIKFRGMFSTLEYSVDNINWTTVESLPWDFFFKVRTDELGTFNYGLALGNNKIPIWKNEEDADEYINGDKPISDAENWDIISPNYPDPDVPGDPDDITEFGEVGARSIFSQQYVVPLACMYELANALFDTTAGGIWEDIKKGLEMYGDSPIEAIEGLMYFPCDLTAIFPGASQPHIYFGGYKLDLQQGSVYRLANPDGEKDLGEVTFNRIYNNFMDFEPYCKLFVRIPYCGEYQLDLSEYYGKRLGVKYFIDTRTGSCCCCLTANGHLVDTFNGQMGVQMPIKLTDFSAYANSQINTLLGGGGQAINQGSQLAGNTAQAVGAGAASAGMLAGAAGLAVGLGGIMGAKTVYGLSQNNINRFNRTKGGSTSMLNMYQPQTICFTFEMNEPDIPDNFYQMNGYPSNAGGRVGNFTGFLKCDSIKLSMPGATDTELEKAKALLLNGVYL